MNKVNNCLRRVREKQKISQQEVADFLEVDRKTYERWEFGEGRRIKNFEVILPFWIASLRSQ